jgi:hypothetical protein
MKGQCSYLAKEVRAMDRSEIKTLWESLSPTLNEKQRRCYAATLAVAYGYGGAKVVHEETGVAPNTITAGKKELSSPLGESNERVRRQGGGRKYVEEAHVGLQGKVREIVDGRTYGDPGRVLSWTTESLRSIARALREQHGIGVSHVTVGEILEGMGYSKQANQKMRQVGKTHPDRHAQFEYIDATAKSFIADGEPVVSVDTKKKGECCYVYRDILY